MPSIDVTYATYVRVRAEFRALHKWGDAKDDVEFLNNWHRHVFKVTMTVVVSHNDRDVEFFQLQGELRAFIQQWEGQKVDKSCEMFAESILGYFARRYNISDVIVSEDGENDGVLWVAKRDDVPGVPTKTIRISWND